jgi:hypothetical protein
MNPFLDELVLISAVHPSLKLNISAETQLKNPPERVDYSFAKARLDPWMPEASPSVSYSQVAGSASLEGGSQDKRKLLSRR